MLASIFQFQNYQTFYSNAPRYMAFRCEEPCRYTVLNWVPKNSKYGDFTRIFSPTLAKNPYISKILRILHRFIWGFNQPHDARFWGYTVFSGTKNRVTRGLAVHKRWFEFLPLSLHLLFPRQAPIRSPLHFLVLSFP